MRRLRNAGMDALFEGDVPRAEALLRRSLLLSEDSGGMDVSSARSAYRLALALHEAEHHDEAARYFEKALTLVRQRAGSGCKLYKTILGHFARTFTARSATVRD